MKRQRGGGSVNSNPQKNPPNVEDVIAMGKKRGKKEVEQQNVVEEEQRKENRDMNEGTTTTLTRDMHCLSNPMSWINWEEYMPWLGMGIDVVDEQMSWGSNWYPAWDIDFMGEAFNSLYSDDVVWDYDIWNLNNEIPIPLHEKRFDFE